MGIDRRAAIAASHAITGIDFVSVAADQQHVDVFFLNDATLLVPSLETITLAQVTIHEPLLGDVAITAIDWHDVDARHVLRITTAAPGGFRPYTLRIDDPRVDPFFNDVPLDFKAGCPTPLDCAPPAHVCPPDDSVDFPVDTTARDWWSLRTALLDFASQRYPDWKDRLEADVGVMLAELMAALGDEMAYFQDRIGREASFESATQRRSVRRHARLVDYEMHDGLASAGWLDLQMTGGDGPQLIPAGADVWAESSSGEVIDGVFVPNRIHFEVGHGLTEVLVGTPYVVDEAVNHPPAHVWDESKVCLPAGATEMWIDKHLAAELPAGKWVMLQTDPEDPSLPARRHLVQLVKSVDELDPLGPDLGIDGEITRLTWDVAYALPFELDLATCTVHGNLVPITAGQSTTAYFSIGPTTIPGVTQAIERTGARESFTYLSTLPDDDGEGLIRIGDPEVPREAVPDVHLTQVTYVGGMNPWVIGEAWTWRRALIGLHSALPDDKVFTLDDGTWTRLVGYQRLGGEHVHHDYRDSDGVTIRFGDGEFGLPPAPGTIFAATYRLGNGTRGNLAAGSVTKWDTTDPALVNVTSAINPLPTSGGLEPELIEDVKKIAPQEFRAITYRAVTADDYAEAAERLPWVQRAGATFRWTGSWLSAMVTPDPKDAVTLSDDRRSDLEAQIDRFRQAGREAIIRDPKYADLDLEITVCVAETSYPGDVVAACRAALAAFFDPDNFTFGTPLERSDLEAALQAVAGVKAVEQIELRRRGYFDWKTFDDLSYPPGDDEVIRVANDRANPDRGSYTVLTEGGA